MKMNLSFALCAVWLAGIIIPASARRLTRGGNATIPTTNTNSTNSNNNNSTLFLPELPFHYHVPDSDIWLEFQEAGARLTVGKALSTVEKARYQIAREYHFWGRDTHIAYNYFELKQQERPMPGEPPPITFTVAGTSFSPGTPMLTWGNLWDAVEGIVRVIDTDAFKGSSDLQDYEFSFRIEREVAESAFKQMLAFGQVKMSLVDGDQSGGSGDERGGAAGRLRAENSTMIGGTLTRMPVARTTETQVYS